MDIWRMKSLMMYGRMLPRDRIWLYCISDYVSQLTTENIQFKAKLKKRSVQIADLKHRIKEYQLKIVDHEYREEKRQGRIEINS